ncbi:MAG: hypothetical protein K2X29_01015 [Candidatus Obscuribacterales bacterium]|nr:hypothetical protein [Candidatus Obscuribacterales bacterium]
MPLFRPRPINRVTPWEKLGLDYTVTEAIRLKVQQSFHASSVEALYLTMLENPEAIAQMLSGIYDNYDELLDRAEMAIGPDSAAAMRGLVNKKFHHGALPSSPEAHTDGKSKDKS